MTPFSETFVRVLIHGAVALTAMGAATMLGLLIRDYRNGRLW